MTGITGKEASELPFLAGGGRMGELIRDFGWERTPLGAASTWPASLRVMVRMLLTTRHPAFIFWGPEHVCIYNDAYSASLGPEKHPSILGQPGEPSWRETWDVIGPQIDMVLRGEGATWHENQLVPILRHGELQDVYWTYSFGPIDDPTAPAGVGGVLVLCTETTRLVQTERRLHGELQRFASLFEHAPAFMAVLSGPQHKVELANPACLRLAGGRELVGRTLLEAVPEANRQGFLILLDRVIQSGQAYSATGAEFSRVTPDGREERRILDFVYQPLRGELGEVTGILVIGVDMTDRTAALDALAQREEQLRLATENGEIGFWDVDMVRDRLYWPPRVKAMFGISTDRDVTMADFHSGLHPEDRELTSAAFAAAADPVRRATYDLEFRTVGLDDGEIRWVAARGRGVFAGGSCTRVVGTATDITKRKRAEARLLELNEALDRRLSEYLAERKLLADIVDATDAFVQVSDLQFRWLAINRASADEFERIYGMRPRVGQCMLDLLEPYPQHRDAVRAVWSRALAGEPFTEVAAFGREERDRRFYEMRFSPLFDERGQRIGAYQFVYDVTARLDGERRLALAEEALHQSQKMEAVGQLTGGIAHDFNNILHTLRTQYELIRHMPADADRVRAWAERGIESTKRAARLTAQLLSFSRKQPFDMKPVSIHALFDGVEALLATTVSSSVLVSVERNGVHQDLHVFADLIQLEMALLNLAINARDAMPKGGTLRIFVREAADDLVEIHVSDDGAGMPPDVASRAFDPFFTTKESGKGSGLGLSQVYGMAQRAGGSVSLSSSIGLGTTVTLRLKRIAKLGADDAEVQSQARSEPHDRRTGLQVLLVDDDASVRQSMADMLGSLGQCCVQATGGDDALAALDRARFDLLLVDFAMPVMDGAALAHLVRQRAPGMPVVFMSGFADVAAIEAAIGQGSILLRKPFDADDLQGVLDRVA